MMNPRLYTTSYNKPQGQQFETAVLSFIKLQYTEKSCKMINIFVLVTILGHLPVILSAKSKGSEDMKQILIVEDDSFLNKMLAYNLTADGYGVTSALNARTAVEAIRQREFDLVLLDINLPDGNGFELCKLIKPQHPDTIVIFLTANNQEGDQIQGANAIVDAMSATIMKRHNPGLTDPQLRQLITAHIDEDSFCRYVIQQDINKIALDLREAHKDDFFSVPEDNPLEDFLQTAEETINQKLEEENQWKIYIDKIILKKWNKVCTKSHSL